MKLRNKLFISIMFVLLAMLLWFNNISRADLTDAQRKTLVQNIENFIKQAPLNNIPLAYSQVGRQIGYNFCLGNKNSTTGPNGQIQYTSQGHTSYTVFDGQKYVKAGFRKAGNKVKNGLFFDCSSFTCAMYDMTFGKGTTGTISNTAMLMKGNYFYVIDKSDLKPGDILNRWKKSANDNVSPHVVIFLGYNADGTWRIAEAHSFGKRLSALVEEYIKSHPEIPGESKIDVTANANTPQVVIRDVKPSQYSTYSACRLKKTPTTCNIVNPFTGVTFEGEVESSVGDISSASTTDFSVLGATTGAYAYWPENFSVQDEVLKNSEGFFHKGMASYGGYTSFVTEYNWLINLASDVSSWFYSLIVNAVRAVILGWAEIFENIAGSILTAGNSQQSVSTIGILSGETRVDVEDIIYNKLPLFDVNVFNMSKAGEETLAQDGLIYKLRTVVSGYYYTVRTIAIIFMLVMLIVTAIKIAFSTAVTEKATAKEDLKKWVVGFIIIMVIHYFMIGIIAINEKGIEVLKSTVSTSTANITKSPTTVTLSTGEVITAITDKESVLEADKYEEETLYEQVRILAYDTNPLTGFAGAILYIMLIIYLIIFAVLYAKRLFSVLLLIIIAPFMGVMYSLGVINNSFKLNVWLKEFAYNVLIQLVHVVIYTLIVGLAVSLLKASTILSAIFACIALGILVKSETIVREIFGFKTQSLGGFEENNLGLLSGYFAYKSVSANVKKIKNVNKSNKSAKKGSKGKHIFINSDPKLMNTIPDTNMKLYDYSSKGEKGGSSRRASSANGQKTSDSTNSTSTTFVMPEIVGTTNQAESQTTQVSEGTINVNTATENNEASNFRTRKPRKTKGAKTPANFEYKSKQSQKRISTKMQTKMPIISVTPEFTRVVSRLGRPNIPKEITGVSRAKTRLKNKKVNFAELVMVNEILKKKKKLTREEKEEIGEEIRNATERVEERIEKEIGRIANEGYEHEITNYKNKFEEKTAKEAMLKNSVAQIRDRKELLEAVKASLEEVDRKTIETTLKEYMSANGKDTINSDDIVKIQKILNEKLEAQGKSIKIENSFTHDIRDTIKHSKMYEKTHGITETEEPRDKLKAKFVEGNGEASENSKFKVSDVVSSVKRIARDANLDKILTDSVVKDIRNDRKIKQAVTKQDEEAVTELIIKKLEEKFENAESNEKLKEGFKENFEEKLHNKYIEKQEVDNALSKMSGEKIVDLMYNLSNVERNINRNLKENKFASISQDVRTLQAYSSFNKELVGKEIYEDISDLILKMHKLSNVEKKTSRNVKNATSVLENMRETKLNQNSEVESLGKEIHEDINDIITKMGKNRSK